MGIHRRAARRDANESEIIQALMLAGASVRQLSGTGLPDLLCAIDGRNFLLEVKMPDGKLTEDQFEFFETWEGQVEVVRSIEEALKVIGR